MPVLTAPAQTYPVGVTSFALGSGTDASYGFAEIRVDFAPWTDPRTTRVRVAVESSLDGGVTWETVLGFEEVAPPPYATRGGQTSSVTVTWHSTPGHPIQVRGSVEVEGASVPLGDITFDVS